MTRSIKRAIILCSFYCIAITITAFSAYSVQSATVYKYQDENGCWRFTDKKPPPTIATEQIEYEGSPENPFELKFKYYKEDNGYSGEVMNPFHLPLAINIYSKDTQKKIKHFVAPGAQSYTFYQGEPERLRFTYHYVFGDPAAKPENLTYAIPVRSPFKQRISQGFNGRFSHFKPSSQYAVDIALDVGTDITAARAGVVAYVKDDYAFGGAKQYFLDKANVVHVLHSDGTYAVYAHLLMGSAVVKPGQSVEVGDKLAESGTSGFSTGPHLHFVVRQNKNHKTVSVPFKFRHKDKAFQPQRGNFVCPCP